METEKGLAIRQRENIITTWITQLKHALYALFSRFRKQKESKQNNFTGRYTVQYVHYKLQDRMSEIMD